MAWVLRCLLLALACATAGCKRSCRVAPTKDRIMSGQKKENVLASIPVLDCAGRAVGDFHRTAANVGLPFCPARDRLALLGHVDGRESRAKKDRRHCTAAVFVMVRAQPHCYPWSIIVRESSGILFIETLGPYLLARCYIRDADDFYNVVQLLFRIVVLLLPFAIFEFVSGQNISRELFAAIFPTLSDAMPPRLGLTRVQSVFDHPILFGVLTGGIFALVHLVLGYQKGFVQRTLRTGIVGATSILSLSSGPIIAMVAQGLLLSGNWLLRAMKIPWKILIGLLILIVLTIEIFANRSLPAIVSSSFLTLDELSYWFRRLIWQYGSASALNHPLFGVGMNEWERPEWMPPSIDNFLLYYAVHYGLPASFLLLLAFLSILLAVGFRKGLNNKVTVYRTAFLITTTAFFMVGWTVHFWGVSYVLFLFLLGSGVWILDVDSKDPECLRRLGPIARAVSARLAPAFGLTSTSSTRMARSFSATPASSGSKASCRSGRARPIARGAHPTGSR